MFWIAYKVVILRGDKNDKKLFSCFFAIVLTSDGNQLTKNLLLMSLVRLCVRLFEECNKILSAFDKRVS